MSIDLEALRKASEGDQSVKVTVNKRWLAEVHRRLVDQQAQINGLRSNEKLGNKLADIGEKLMGMTGGGMAR